MRNSISVFNLPVKAAADIKEFTFVGISGANPAAGGYALGIAAANCGAGDMAAVDVLGTASMLAGGVIAVGSEIEVGAGGKGVAKTTGKTVARALEAASADDVIEVLLVQS